MKKVLTFLIFFFAFTLTVFSDGYCDEHLKILTPKGAANLTFQELEKNKLLISVVDEEDNPVKGLTVDDFVIQIEKKKAQILSVETMQTSKEVGLNIVMVVDNSSSMQQRFAVRPLLDALDEFFKTIRPIDRVTIIVFDDEAAFRVNEHILHVKTFQSGNVHELRDFTRRTFERGLTSSTYMFEAILAGIDTVRKIPEKENKFLVVFSDGEDIGSAFGSTVVEAEAAGIPRFEAYSIDYMPRPKPDPFLKSFAESHGGRIWKAREAKDLLPIFKSFSTKLLYRYIVTYRFLSPPKGTVTMEPAELNFEMYTLLDGSQLMNTVFFEEGRSELTEPYVLFFDRSETGGFDEASLKTAREKYFHILNITGRNMAAHPHLSLRITGFISAPEMEKDGTGVARRRAEFVRDYLFTIWNIQPGRLSIDAQGLPKPPSPQDKPGGNMENQRVELRYTDKSVQEKVGTVFVVEKNDVHSIKVTPHIVAEYGVAGWELQIADDKQPLKSLEGSGELNDVYEIDLDHVGKDRLLSSKTLEARIRVVDTTDEAVDFITDEVPVSVSKKQVIHDVIQPPHGTLTIEPEKITIEELTTIDSSPFLNYVFFYSGKSEIPERYVLFSQAETGSFNEGTLKSPIDKYRHILNILGKRLVDHADARITIVGCNSNYGSEKNRVDLSRSRAEAVRSYLRYVWGIDPSRMEIEVRNLPVSPSTNRVDEGREENQRVEIYSDTPEILDTIQSTYVVEMTDTEEVRIVPAITAGYGIYQWKIDLLGDDTLITSLSGTEDIQPVYPFTLKDMGLQKIGSFRHIGAEIEVVDTQNQSYKAFTEIPASVEFIKRQERATQKMGYKVMEKYALILFDYDSEKIKDRNRVIVERIIGRVKEYPNTVVGIVGHTDTIGKEEYNLRLSERRAKAVYDQMLSAGMSQDEKISYRGAGPHEPIYDNSLPEGRALNRTVTVTLEYEREDFREDEALKELEQKWAEDELHELEKSE